MVYCISFVIRTFGEEYLEYVLRALFSQNLNSHKINEIVIVNGKDDFDPNNCATLKDNKYPLIWTNVNQKEFSHGRALNKGIRLTTGDIIVFLSGHSVPTNSNWLMNLLSPFEHGKTAGVCGAQRYRAESNIIEKAYRLLWYNSSSLALFFGHFNLANAAIRKAFWDICHFDEEIECCEDRLWAKIVKKYGGKIVFSKDATVIHSHVCSIPESMGYFLWLWKTIFKICVYKGGTHVVVK